MNLKFFLLALTVASYLLPNMGTKKVTTTPLIIPSNPSSSLAISRFTTSVRIIAIGDIHSDFKQMRSVLILAGLLDLQNRWIGGTAILVQTGDMIDRGHDTIACLRLLIELELQAKQAGGAVISLLGNHEVMNIQGEYRYVQPAEVATFDSQASRSQQFSVNGWIGHYLAGLPVGAKLGSSLFFHAGPAGVWAKQSIADINAATNRALYSTPAGPANVLNNKGPLWYRGYANGDESVVCPKLKEMLAFHGADRLVTGHTVTNGFIVERCGGKLILIDVGISSFYGSYLAALEIVGSKVTAIYPGGRIHLSGL